MVLKLLIKKTCFPKKIIAEVNEKRLKESDEEAKIYCRKKSQPAPMHNMCTHTCTNIAFGMFLKAKPSADWESRNNEDRKAL